MSSIEKMSIQGIRSFGVDQKQMISFFTPLTLILGPNGTGKTTIIESLKYITCGEMPPGGKVGGAFIHDPKIAHEREVKAQVRLQFKDCSGKMTVVQRSIVASQTAKSVSVKQLEGVITRQGKDGQKHSTTSKCIEIDREMVSLLGVAKPVLDNVIFCHQEDASWPLSEGKALKQKFDDIFASTRYVKALEAIRKLKQEQVGQIKEYKAEIHHLKFNKEKAQEIRENLSSIETRYTVSKDDVKKIKEKLEPIEDQLEVICEKSSDLYKKQSAVEKLRGEKNQMEQSVQDLRDNISQEFQGSTEALKQALKDFQQQVQEKQEMFEQFQARASSLAIEIEKNNKDKTKFLLEQGKLAQEAERQKDFIKKRDRRIQQLADEYNLEGVSVSQQLSDDDIADFTQMMQAKYEESLQQAKAYKERYEEKENELQHRIDEVRDTRTKLEQSEKMKKEQLKKNVEEIKAINRKLNEVDASADKLEQLGRDLKREEYELKQAEKSINIDKLRAEITKLQKTKEECDKHLRDLSEEQTKMSNQASARAQLNMMEKENTVKEEQIHKIKTKHQDTLIHLLGHMPSENTKQQLEKYIGNQEGMLNKLNQEVRKMVVSISSKEANKKNVAEQLRKKEDQLSDYENKISEVCGSQSFESGIDTIKNQLEDAQGNKANFTGSETVYKHFLKRVKSQKDQGAEDTECPLCMRPFSAPEEVDELVEDMEKKLRLAPQKLKRFSDDVDVFQRKYNEMLKLQPIMEQMEVLRDQEIPNAKKKVKSLNEELKKLNAEKEELEEDLAMKMSDSGIAKSAIPDLAMMESYTADLKDLKKKIASQSSKFSDKGSTRTLTDVNNEKEEVQIQLDNTNRNLDSKRNKLDDHIERVNELKATVNSIQEEKLHLESDLANTCKLEETKTELTTANQNFEKEIREARQQMQPLGQQWESLIKEKKKITSKKEEQFDSMKEEAVQILTKKNGVSSTHAEIQRYISAGRDRMLEDIQEKLKTQQTKIGKVEKEKEEIEDNSSRLYKDITSQKEKQRDLSDNLQMRKKQEEIRAVEQKVSQLEQQLGGINTTNLAHQQRQLEAQKDKLVKEKSQKEGRQTGLEEEMRKYRKELKESAYKDADKKYRDMMIDLRTTEIANQDLDKYYKALDRAIMQYHKVKMDEINKIIRELWRNTYRGNDIETIEIRSDEDLDGMSKQRRVYHYRVVMIKGDTALDMRNRCSAGQKVLASLIIRLALAETFCLNCGILALDEPTTNLDRDNIESLAHALVQIIKEREQQRNFQMVVITHDEDFVELLGRSEYVEEFWKVRKDDYGCSQIVKAKVQDLGSR